MITGFEEITRDLTDKEKNLLPVLAQVINQCKGEGEAKKNNEIRHSIYFATRHDVNEATLRKMINVAHRLGYLPNLKATSRGYYIAQSKKELEDYYKSLIERAEAIQARAEQVAYDIRNFTTQKTLF